MATKLERTLTILVGFTILFSAMINPLISFSVVVAFFTLFAFYKLYRSDGSKEK
ncbi:MAG: hypothetical protein QXJ17_07050 [Nitrososphaeria archaeon]